MNTSAYGLIGDNIVFYLQRQLKAAVGVMVLLGTGWVVGIFMNFPSPALQVILQYVFIALNATQVI